jgi:hypothetical protein
MGRSRGTLTQKGRNGRASHALYATWPALYSTRGHGRRPSRCGTLRPRAGAPASEGRTGTVGREDTDHPVQSAPTCRETQRRVAGGGVPWGTARKQLRTSWKRLTAWCKSNRHLRWPVLFTRLNAKLRGYSNESGVHGNAATLQACFTSAIRILLKWLNRRSPRHGSPWPGSNEVLERFTVARPRSVGRPQTRQAPLTTSANLRKRGWLKRAVRANRTPGSVRGPSGTWRSYRDGTALEAHLQGDNNGR